MKKAAKIILPILIALAIILGIGWYLFEYDTEFTRDMLLMSARKFESKGNHGTAAWFYDLAYSQAADNDDVAIELAQQHKKVGNYTQAELTLTNAISDGGGAELYIALSNLYLEQDKILDSVKLLDAVCSEKSTVSEDVKQALISRRPAAPTVSHEPGFYSQYINITVTAEGGGLCMSTLGQYPSIHEKCSESSQDVTLVDGENIIYALSISDDGLVSPLSIFGYTVGGVIEQVEFVDGAIEQQVRTLLNLAPTTPVYSNDLWSITEFVVPEDATKLEDLKHMIRLETLTIRQGESGQLRFLSALTDLRVLSIEDMSVSAQDISLIGNLPKLEQLTLHNCGLSTLAGLENATKLTYLDISENTVRNITPLSGATALRELNMAHNALTDLSALATLRQLTCLDVSYNTLTNVDALGNTSALQQLDASHNSINDISALKQLSGLTQLNLNYNSISDVSTLGGCTALNELYLSNNAIADLSALASLTQLRNFDFSYNQVQALPDWDAGCQLVTIDGSHNLLTSLEPLSGMNNLNKVSMDYNPELKSITCLTKCHHLIQVNVYGTKVTEIKPLLDMSVIVNYDPTT